MPSVFSVVYNFLYMNKYKILSIIFILNCFAPSYLFSADMNLIASLSGDKIMGKFNQPSAIFFDESKKRLYVADTGNNRLVSFDPDFNFISEFDAGGELKYPMSSVRNSKEQFFVIGGAEKNGLFVIDISKKVFKQFDIRDAPARENPILPGKLAIDKNDNLYITDKANGRILVVDSNGRHLKEIKLENKLVDFSDIRVDADGNIYSLSTLERKIYIFNNKGVLISSFGKMGNKVNEFEFPVSIAISPNGFIYVLDQHKGSILTFKKDGVFQPSFSNYKWKNQGELYEPYYIFADMGNKVYIVDRGNNRIQIFQGEK